LKQLIALILIGFFAYGFAQTDTQDITITNGAVDAIIAPADVALTLTANNTWATGAAGTLDYTNAIGGGEDIFISATIPDATLTLELNVTGPTVGTLALAGFTAVNGTPQAFITGIPGNTYNATANVTARVQTNNIGALAATSVITVTYDMN
jgi:hypothetical protein